MNINLNSFEEIITKKGKRSQRVSEWLENKQIELGLFLFSESNNQNIGQISKVGIINFEKNTNSDIFHVFAQSNSCFLNGNRSEISMFFPKLIKKLDSMKILIFTIDIGLSLNSEQLILNIYNQKQNDWFQVSDFVNLLKTNNYSILNGNSTESIQNDIAYINPIAKRLFQLNKTIIPFIDLHCSPEIDDKNIIELFNRWFEKVK
jgi:hypothetical protein